jgi:hypothetical protein
LFDEIHVREIRVSGHTFRATFPPGFAMTAFNAVWWQIARVFNGITSDEAIKAHEMLCQVFEGDTGG